MLHFFTLAQAQVKIIDKYDFNNNSLPSKNNINVVLYDSLININNQVSSSNKNSLIDFYANRINNRIVLYLSTNSDIHVKQLAIERKTSAYLSVFTPIKIFDNNELNELHLTKKILFKDEFPESNKLEAYYRIVFEDNFGVIRIMPYIQLPKISAKSTSNINIEDAHLFVFPEDTLIYFSKDYGIDLSVQPEQTYVIIKLTNIDLKFNPDVVWSIERKSEKHLANYKLIKPLSNNEIIQFIENGELSFIDRFPESRKLDAYYRLRFTDTQLNLDVFFEPVLLPGLKPK